MTKPKPDHCAGRQPVEDGHHRVCRQPVYLDGRCWAHYWSSKWPLPIPGLPETPDPDWREQAACKGMDHELFYMSKGERPPPEVVEACAGCSVRGDCLVFELQTGGNHQFGVWGGLAPEARLKLRKRLGLPQVVRRSGEVPYRVGVPDREAHGTRVGYQRHLRRNQEPCEACRDANTAYHAERRAS